MAFTYTPADLVTWLKADMSYDLENTFTNVNDVVSANDVCEHWHGFDNLPGRFTFDGRHRTNVMTASSSGAAIPTSPHWQSMWSRLCSGME